jgi:hypothetical protein
LEKNNFLGKLDKYQTQQVEFMGNYDDLYQKYILLAKENEFLRKN